MYKFIAQYINRNTEEVLREINGTIYASDLSYSATKKEGFAELVGDVEMEYTRDIIDELPALGSYDEEVLFIITKSGKEIARSYPMLKVK